MAIVAGVDVGSLCTKTVILNDEGEILSYDIMRSGAFYKGAAEKSFNSALEKAGLRQSDVDYVISTGYGRARVPFKNRELTEIFCHARGAKKLNHEVRTIIDIGGQDSKVIHVSDRGDPVRFVMNDKCAAGTGRFLEVMAGGLGVELEEMSKLAPQAKKRVEVSSVCTVFAESEVISLIADGYDKTDIAAAIFRAIARRISGLVGQIGLEEKVMMTGGVAKSPGVVRAIEESLNTNLLVPEEPQITGAYGAALIALEKLREK